MTSASFSPDFCASQLKALADPTRWAVVVVLSGGERPAGRIAEMLQVDQTLLSHHLKILKSEGFVIARREWRELHYSLAPEVRLTSDKRGLDLGCCRLEFDPDRHLTTGNRDRCT